METENMEEDVDGDLEDIEALNYDDLDSVSKLQKTQWYIDIMLVGLYLVYARSYFMLFFACLAMKLPETWIDVCIYC